MVIILLLFFGINLRSSDICDNWFLKTGAKVRTFDCESICTTASVDMGTFSCPSNCERLCKSKKPCILDPYWNRLLQADPSPFKTLKDSEKELVTNVMGNKVSKNIFFALMLFFLNDHAVASSARPLPIEEKIDKIKIGDSKEKVVRLWEQKPEENKEKYDLTVVEQLNYLDSKGRPEAVVSISLDSNKVIGKSFWVYNELSKSNLEEKLKGRFKHTSWKEYVPCHTRSDKDKILVDDKQGLTLDIGGNGVALVSWSSPELLQQRINLILKTCPKLQGPTK